MTILRIPLMGTRVDAGSRDEMEREILRLSRSPGVSRVLFANVHMVVESWRDANLRKAMETADLVCPDGTPLVWLLRRWVPGQPRMEGMSAFPRLMSLAAGSGIPVGWFGSTGAVQEAMVAKAGRELADLPLALSHSPPFADPSDEDIATQVDRIRKSGARMVFVGLGCPRQELWMARADGLDACLLGVGNAFEIWLGLRRRAPPWARRLGLEWSFRLFQEPRRLARRYFRSNLLFLLALPGWLWKTRRFSI